MSPKPTSPATVKLSADTTTALDALAKRFGVDRPQMVERLIFGTAREVTPDQEKK